MSFQFVKPNLLGSGNLFLCRGNDGFELGIEAGLGSGGSGLGDRNSLGGSLRSLHGFHDGSEFRIDSLVILDLAENGFELGIEDLRSSLAGLFGLELAQDGFELCIKGVRLGSTFT